MWSSKSPVPCTKLISEGFNVGTLKPVWEELPNPILSSPGVKSAIIGISDQSSSELKSRTPSLFSSNPLIPCTLPPPGCE